MSDTDSFIEEVTEEVRRDKLFKMLKPYGWVAGAALVVVIGGVAWSEYNQAQQRAAAQAVGDGLLTALSEDAPAARLAGLEGVTTPNASSAALVAFLKSAEQIELGENAAAAETLQAVVDNTDVPLMYRQIARFKALGAASGTMTRDERRAGYSELTTGGGAMRLLAEEQLALIEIEAGNNEDAVKRLQSILDDAEGTAGLQQRALQVIVALGGEPDMSALQAPQAGN
jgi:hypothetical protein